MRLSYREYKKMYTVVQEMSRADGQHTARLRVSACVPRTAVESD